MLKQLLNIMNQNEPEHLVISAAIAFAVFTVFAGIRYLIDYRLKKSARHHKSIWNEAVRDVLSSTSVFMLFVFCTLLGFLLLDMPVAMHSALLHITAIVVILQCGFWIGSIIRQWIKIRINRDHQKGVPGTGYEIMSYALRLVLWTVIVLLILSNLGINVSTLLASLGIGGVAVALAVQNILGDLFASLSIVMDKPFEVGDFLSIGELTGTVRHIGLKTTRLTSITGEELVFANSDLLKSRIHNYKKMQERRVVYTLGVEFDTPPEKLRQINEIVREIFDTIPNGRLSRVHFSRISQSTLDFEIVYYVESPDYQTYMDVQEAFNLAVMERFSREKIAFAYPTQTLQIQHASSVPVPPGDPVFPFAGQDVSPLK